RAISVRWWIAALCGLAYEFTGVTLSFVYAGHDGRIIAATLLPLVLLCITRAVESGAPLWFAALAATVGTLLLSFQIQAAYYVLLAGAAWGLFVAIRTASRAGARVIERRVGMCLLAIVLAFGIAGVNFVPFSGYIAESPRANAGGRGYDFATSFSMPPAETIGLAVPEWHGVLDSYKGLSKFKYHTEYAGAFVLVLIVMGLRTAWRDARWRFFAGLAAFALVMAWGGYTPVYRLYYRIIPGLSRFRAPSIGFFLVAFSLVTMAAIAMEALAEKRARVDTRKIGLSLLSVGLILGIPLVFGAASSGSRAEGFLRFAAFSAAVLGLLWMWWRGLGNPRVVFGALALVIVADLCIVGRRFMETVDPPSELLAADDVASFLQQQHPTRVWVYPAPAGTGSGYLGNGTFGVSTDYLMHFKLRQVGGEHGNQLQRWNDFAGGSAERMIDFNHLVARGSLLNAASVDYIVATVELVIVRGSQNETTDRLTRVYANDKVLVYRNNRAMPRAYFTNVVHLVPTREMALAGILAELWQPADSTIVEVDRSAPFPELARGPVAGSATIEADDDPDHIVIHTTSDRDAMLVLTEAYASGWQVAIDGVPTRIYPANYAFRGVNVPKGAHTVRFEFRPPAVYAGVKLSLASLGVLIIFAGAALARRRSQLRTFHVSDTL
ncbi:MAG: Protein of unknown function, rane YfhO, partial [Gemmatimonadetes bacterium]|nr:Protein of unknown function, rane YfhO [Gemmatimonadota bacterium]